MDKKILTAVVIILTVLGSLMIVRFLSPEDAWICVEGEWVMHGAPAAAMPAEDCPGQKNIIIESPESGQVVGKNLVVKGRARVFENQLNWAVLNAVTNEEIAAGTAYANAEDIGLFGPFVINISLSSSTPEKIIVQAFDYSAKDGSKQDVYQIPLNFDNNLKDHYEVYFSNGKLDPETSCLKVFPISNSVGNEELSLRKALETMLQGPSEKDKADGYYTNIPANVKVNKIEQRGNSVKVDLSKDIEVGMGGSCRVAAVRAQIVKTVLAFDRSIRSVTISVEGEVETALQP